MCLISSSVTCLTIFPGLPITKDLSGITLFSVTKALAPIIEYLPILALFRIVLPIPIKQSSSITHHVTSLNVQL